MSWALPSTPNHKLYRELEAELDYLSDTDPREAMVLFRAVSETDFWFFQKYVCSLGSFRIKDKAHPRFGGLYVDEPWFFDRAREVQEVFETRQNRVWFKWFRFSFKTTSIAKNGSLWILSRDEMETIAIFTHKVQQVGESMGGDLLDEIKNNEVLSNHWPQFRKLKEASDTRITLDRPSGPKEPSISVMPVLGSATSGHYTRIFNDDVTNDVIIESKQLIRKVDRQLNRQEPLRHDDTPVVFLGTVWGGNDPMVTREREGYFTKISHQPAFLAGNIPQLRSKEFFLDKKKGIRDDFEWNAQYMLRIVSRGGRYFRDEWRRYFAYTPEQMAVAVGGSIAFVIDPAGGGEDSDFFTIRVVALGYDRNIYNLDLWREQELGETDVEDILFGTTSNAPEDAWKPREGLIQKWQKVDRHLIVWVEEFGASAWLKNFRREAKARLKSGELKIDVTFRELPKLNRSKAARIRFLQGPYRDGRIFDPVPVSQGGRGFGHGSKEDSRDTLDQYYEDEYSLWSLAEDMTAYGTVNDDCLDPEAWLFQPEVIERLAWPFVPGGGVPSLGWPHSSDLGGSTSGGVRPSQISWSAY